MAAEQKYTKAQIEEALIEGRGFVSAAAKHLKCDRKTIYAYLKRYPKLKELRKAQMEQVGDDVEETLFDVALGKRAENGLYLREPNITALIFLAKTRFSSRGYVERRDITSDNKPIQFALELLEAEDAPDADE